MATLQRLICYHGVLHIYSSEWMDQAMIFQIGNHRNYWLAVHGKTKIWSGRIVPRVGSGTFGPPHLRLPHLSPHLPRNCTCHLGSHCTCSLRCVLCGVSRVSTVPLSRAGVKYHRCHPRRSMHRTAPDPERLSTLDLNLARRGLSSRTLTLRYTYSAPSIIPPSLGHAIGHQPVTEQRQPMSSSDDSTTRPDDTHPPRLTSNV